MSEETAPEYRLRVFLSVDLVGSTAYKSKEGSTNLKWIKAFQKFYGEFPKHFIKNYIQICGSTPEIDEKEANYLPKVWKTIGDEILFVNKVNSITHLGAYIKAFSNTLIEFGRDVSSSFELNTKGNAWIAAFPDPNRSIRLSTNGSDPLLGESEILTEKFEADVDLHPNQYDFLGKGIDSVFRISRNSSIESLTISPALAYLLCKAKRNVDTTQFDCRFAFHEPQEFKGVVKGQKYPVISLITSRNENFDNLQKLEAELLDRPREADFVSLFKYLEAYLQHHNIEKPELILTANSAPIKPPLHYQNYIKEWKDDLESIMSAKSYEDSALNPQNDKESKKSIADEPEAISLDDLLKKIKEATDFKKQKSTPSESTEN